MTNLDGLALLVLALYIGFPLLIVALIFGYFLHRNDFDKSQSQEESQKTVDSDNYLDAIREILIRPGSFFKKPV